MTIFDLILILIIGFFVLNGLWFGLIQAIGSLVGVLIGAWAAGQYYIPVADWLSQYVSWGDQGVKVFAFIIIFIIVNRLVGFIFWIIGKIFKILTIIPFLNSINRLLGGLLGFFEGILVVGLLLYVASRYSFSVTLDDAMAASEVASWIIKSTALLLPLLPEALKLLKSVINR